MMEDEAERRLLVCQMLMVRLFRTMLPVTPMWRAMPKDGIPGIADMNNEEIVQSVETASHWQDPATTTCADAGQIDTSRAEFRAVTSETPPPPSTLEPQTDNGSPQKPIVIDDSDDE